MGVENKSLCFAPKEAAREGLAPRVAGGGVKRLASLGEPVVVFFS